MKKTFLDRRIPSFAGLVLLAISIGMVSWYGQQLTGVFTRASAGEAPKNIQISNITDTSFTVSYITDDETISTLAYGKGGNFGQVGLDSRDQQISSASAHRLHYFTLSGLSAGTKYFFGIQSGSNTFLNNGQPYEVTTRNAPLYNQSPQTYVVSGSAHLPDGNIPLEGIAYLSTATASESAQLSTLLQPDGNYSFKDLRALYPLEENSILQLTVTSNTFESKVSVLTKFANPVPLITLSKDYDFTLSASGITETTPTASGSGFPLSTTEIASGPAILTPKDEEKFKDAQPLFQGTAVPGETVEITIQSDSETQVSVQADNLGNWQFRPAAPLNPGEHTITIVTKDANGILQTIKRSFTVYAGGSQFVDSISPTQVPSPTIALTPTPSVVPPPVPVTPTPGPTTIPTITVAPTITPTPASLQPTATVAPAPVVTTPPLAPTGSYDVLIGGGIAILLFIAGAFMLFFL